MKETINRYANAWNEPTAETIKAGFVTCCSPDVVYTDKNTPEIAGIDALVALAMESHQKVPGRTFTVETEPEYFDSHCYYSWGVNIPGTGLLIGHDYVEYDAGGLITRIVGFLPVN